MSAPASNGGRPGAGAAGRTAAPGAGKASRPADPAARARAGEETLRGAAAVSRTEFEVRTLAWLRTRLLKPGAHVDATTPLFENGLIDSMRILKLLAWTEQMIGRRIADHEIRMDYFATVRRMAEVFITEDCDVES